MGRGDKRSRKGKIFKGSYGNVRPHRVHKAVVAKAAGAAAPAVKAAKPALSVKKK
jgi:30S ribosomal protein S31